MLVGPGENAGVIDAGDGIAVAIRIESHNHPSAIEPYQGAATGVGGILRDIFTMGARPIAVMDPLFFGDPGDARQQWLIEGVVAGISGYGNSVGVPTVGGELTFNDCYAQNPLVNVLCMGVLPTERLVLGRPPGSGTWPCCWARPPAGTASAGSACWPRPASAAATPRPRRPSGRACRWATPTRRSASSRRASSCSTPSWWSGSRTSAGAGLVCATSETAARGGVGMDVDVSAVPRREPGMAALRGDDLGEPGADAGHRHARGPRPGGRGVPPVGGALRGGGPGHRAPGGQPGPAAHPRRLRRRGAGRRARRRPERGRPALPPAHGPARPTTTPGGPTTRAPWPAPADCGPDLLALLSDPSWVYRQYDHQLFLNTVDGPGGDAAVLRLAAPGLPPRSGAWRCPPTPTPPGARSIRGPAPRPRWPRAPSTWPVPGPGPMAVVNCLNFGNPEHPEVMWQLSEAIDGMTEACLALGLPVIGGNVSLYNESFGIDIDPTPVIGVLGLIDRLAARPPGVTLVDGATLVLLDASVGASAGRRNPPSLAGSRWAVERRGHRNGTLPALDLAGHHRLVEFVTGLVAEGVAGGRLDAAWPWTGIHDVSGGGLGRGAGRAGRPLGIGLQVAGVADHHELFTEAPSRVVVCTTRRAELISRAAEAGVGFRVLGRPAGTAGGGGPGRRGRGRAHCRGVAGSLPSLLDGLAPVRRGRRGSTGGCDPIRPANQACRRRGPDQAAGRRSCSWVSTRSGTLRSPRPVPTRRSGLIVPWWSEPPVATRSNRRARLPSSRR